MPYAKPRWKPRLRRSFALPAPGLSVSPCLATRPPHEILVSWPANFIRGDAICEATLEAPAQAELRPTCAGAFRVILPCDATPDEILVSLPVNFIRGDAICEASAGSHGSGGASPYLRRGFPYHPGLRRDPSDAGYPGSHGASPYLCIVRQHA